MRNAVANGRLIDLDHIESQFRAAVKELPEFAVPQVQKVMLVTDLSGPRSNHLLEQVKVFLAVLGDDVEWTVVPKDQFASVESLLGHAEVQRPDLIVTYRHLQESQNLPYSLGTYCDMLTQVMTTPILLLPKPTHPQFEARIQNTDRIMVVTDHIVGQSNLINWGLRMVQAGGRLVLAHVEDDATFDRYIGAIGKIAGLDTEFARVAIEKQLLGEARGYIAATADGIALLGKDIETVSAVRMGHAVGDYKALVDEHEVDILVFNTKDEGQLAMHGVAYPIAVELIGRPLLML